MGTAAAANDLRTIYPFNAFKRAHCSHVDGEDVDVLYYQNSGGGGSDCAHNSKRRVPRGERDYDDLQALRLSRPLQHLPTATPSSLNIQIALTPPLAPETTYHSIGAVTSLLKNHEQLKSTILLTRKLHTPWRELTFTQLQYDQSKYATHPQGVM